MILFLYGEDTYRSKQKLDAIKSKYIDASLGDTNLSVMDIADKKDTDFTDITRTVLALPFLAKNRLVIIKNLLNGKKQKLQEQVLGFLDKVPETTFLVFYEERMPDRRTTLFKRLNPSSAKATEGKTKVQEFRPLEGNELRRWIKTEIERQNAKIEPAAIEKLAEYVGNDLWKMSNEIDKLIAYSLSLMAKNDMRYAICTKHIELLVKPKIESNIFAMIDAIGNKDADKTVKELHKLLDSGENELYILTMIVYQFRNLLIIKDLMEDSKIQDTRYKIQTNYKSQFSNFQIAKQSGLNPYVAQKTTAQARNFTFERLKEIYQLLLEYDIKIKTGKIEPKTALDVLMMELI